MRIRSKAFHARSCEEYYLKAEHEAKKEESRSLTHSPQERELQNRPRSTCLRGRFSLVAESERDFQRAPLISQNDKKNSNNASSKELAQTKKMLDSYLLEAGAFDSFGSVDEPKNHHKEGTQQEKQNHNEIHHHKHNQHKEEENKENNTNDKAQESEGAETIKNVEQKSSDLQGKQDVSEKDDPSKKHDSDSSSSSSNGTSSSDDDSSSSSSESSDSDRINRLNQLESIQFYENEDFSWSSAVTTVLRQRTQIMILGEQNIGKTELLRDIFLDGQFPPKLNGHQTFDLMVHYINSTHLLNLWIQNLSIPTFQWIVEQVYYQIMKVFIFLYNTSDELSLVSVRRAYEIVKVKAPNAQCLLIGIHHPEHTHKCSSPNMEELKAKAHQFAEANRFALFFEHTFLQPIQPSLLLTINQIMSQNQSSGIEEPQRDVITSRSQDLAQPQEVPQIGDEQTPSNPPHETSDPHYQQESQEQSSPETALNFIKSREDNQSLEENSTRN